MTNTAPTNTAPTSADAGRAGPVVGMVRGGQLARMTAQAAERLGIELRVLDLSSDCPAALAGANIVVGDPGDLDDLLAFAAQVDAVCFDDESVPVEHLRALEQAGTRLLPPPDVAVLSFDKSIARRWFADHDFPVPAWATAHDAAAVTAFGDRVGWPVVAKAATNGYDGRGVRVVAGPDEVEAAVAALGTDLVVEELVPFDAEVGVTVARRSGGQAVSFPPFRTHQRDGICVRVDHPSGFDPSLAAAASDLALRLAEAAGVVGLMTVELFAVGDRLLVNELALRPHNSAHLTIDAFDVSQFDLVLLAGADRELPQPRAVVAAASMGNLLGTAEGRAPVVGADGPDVRVHWYDKEPRPGRKIGHVTVVGERPEAVATLLARAVDGVTLDEEVRS